MEGCSGVAFLDLNANSAFEAGESALAGVPLTLTGVTNQGTAVSATLGTDDAGGYTFANLLPGTYQLSAGPNHGLLLNQSGDVVASFTIAGGDSITQNVGFRGIDPRFVSLRQFPHGHDRRRFSVRHTRQRRGRRKLPRERHADPTRPP